VKYCDLTWKKHDSICLGQRDDSGYGSAKNGDGLEQKIKKAEERKPSVRLQEISYWSKTKEVELRQIEELDAGLTF
jgi:hypothetical protein